MVTLTWTASPGATGYTIRSGTDQGGPYGIVEENFAGTLFIDDTLDNGTTYFYVISASNAAGEGPRSPEVSATPTGGSGPPPTQTWTRSAVNPVLTGSTDPQAWDANVFSPSVVMLSSSSWVMYFTGHRPSDGSLAIGRAVSSDGLTWTKEPATPILMPGPAGTWDGSSVQRPFVIFDGSSFRMWYVGDAGAGPRIGLATSADGITWTRVSGPVLSAGAADSWEAFGVTSPRVILENGVYKMWYSGINRTGATGLVQIGYATSTDGVSWTKNSVPVLTPTTGSFDARGVADLMVVRDANGFQAWYSGLSGASGPGTYRIGAATSTDGVTWTKLPAGSLPQPVLDLGSAGSWDADGVSIPFVLQEGTLLRMWYTGGSPATGAVSIGLATSGS